MMQSLERLEGHMAATAAQDREIVIARLGEHLASQPVILERTFDAPVDTGWRASTEVGQMKQWYFPQLESFKAETGFETEFNVAEGEKNFFARVSDQQIAFETDPEGRAMSLILRRAGRDMPAARLP